MIVVWAKENYSNPASEYTNRVEFSFLKKDQELILNIHLKNISELDAGIYTCYMQLNDEEMETVELIVTGGPYSITLRPNESIIYEFDALNITCVADCYLSCWFQWIKHDKHEIPELIVSDSATMQLLNATRDKAGNYSCIATNTVTNTTLSENITLNIIYGPNYVNFSDSRMTNSAVREKFTIVNCSADCYPLCEYSLTVPGQETIYSKETLHNVTENGTYTCTAINPATGKSSETRILTISYELDKLSTPFLTNILLGTALFFTCFIGGLIMYKSRKGLCRPSSIVSSPASCGPPGIDHGIRKDFEMVHANIDQINKYWTIGQDNTGRLHTVIDDSGASEDPRVGLRCTIMQNMTPDDLDEIRPQADDDTYIHPV
ncbi:hypothetical protein ACJMK2_017280 [Sinanodonta woodiana]|uniref:Ig-like domain-containing protein n=1 Tax=Sinanodonta woodiana TaxID=1069815 RepID=A0ABD3UXP7_SINWO